MKRIFAVLLIIVMVFAFAACAVKKAESNGIEEYAPVIGGEGVIYDRAYKSASDAITAGGVYEGVIADPNGNERISAGQITAKAWNDNDNYEKWNALFAAKTDNDPAGKFAVFRDGEWAYDTSMRVKITVTEGEKPVAGAQVFYSDPRQEEWIACTDAKGVAYLFPQEKAGSLTVTSGKAVQKADFSENNRDLIVDLSESEERANLIKIMFVIDATGSMGDEMRYLAAELADVVERVTEQAEQVKIDLSLLFYRDEEDEEEFSYYDFERVSEREGLQKQGNALSSERAQGGGDYPEAVDEALLLGVGKDWGEENCTRLMLLVLDAPPHSGSDYRTRSAEAMKQAAAKGIRICPVLCSGADAFCEYFTRLGALLTGGTSVFITDDSGIGGEHLDPNLPDATVERLNDLLVRLIVGYHSGDFGVPTAWNQTEAPAKKNQN